MVAMDAYPDLRTNTHAIGGTHAPADMDAKRADDRTDAQPVDGAYASALDLTDVDPSR